MKIDLEKNIHGKKWNKAHGGYFANPTVSYSYLTEILTTLKKSKPDVLTDLGGGTGYILSELLQKGIPESIKLVNIDLSDAQLSQVHSDRIKKVNISFTNFTRNKLADPNQQFMFIARSILHYVSRNELMNLLAHIRSQMRPGEIFLHQTACFKMKQDADCLNSLYEQMNTGKWYPVLTELQQHLEKNGFKIVDVKPGPALPLKQAELSERYVIPSEKMAIISKKLQNKFGAIKDVIEFSDKNFTAYLHYHIYFCVAGRKW